MDDSARQTEPLKANRMRGLVISTLMLLAAFGLQILFKPLVGAVGLLFVYPAVFLISWFFDYAVVIWSVLFSLVVVKYFFMAPHYTTSPASTTEGYRLLVFLGTSLGVGWLTSRGRRAEAAYRTSDVLYRQTQARFARVIKATGLGVWYSDLPDGMIHWSAETKRHFFLAEDARVTRELFYSRIHPEDRGRVVAAVARSVQEHAPYDVEFRSYDGADASRFKWLHAIGWTGLDRLGASRTFDGITLDVTEQKKTSEERDLALLEANEALRTRDEFMSVASHELKTPLTSLHLQLQMLSRTLDGKGSGPDASSPEKLRALVDACEKQSRKLNKLLDELLDLTRVRLGKLQLIKEPVDLSVLTREVLASFKQEIDQKGYAVDFTPAPEARPAVGQWDRARVEQVVSNLLSNAVKYGDAKPISIVVESDAAHDRAVLTVRDHGMGVPTELQEKIFERFERATSWRKTSGLGLGLYIARQIVDAHGGSIAVESRDGAGSTFRVELPYRSHGDSVSLTEPATVGSGLQ